MQTLLDNHTKAQKIRNDKDNLMIQKNRSQERQLSINRSEYDIKMKSEGNKIRSHKSKILQLEDKERRLLERLKIT